MKLTKDVKIFIILLGLLGITFAGQNFLFYNFSTEENLVINGQSNNVHYQIHRPAGTKGIPIPAVIVIHGDFLNGQSLNYLIMEFLHNQYEVVTVHIDTFNASLYDDLELLVTHLENNLWVIPSQIGIFGHSRGASFAYNFAATHDAISGTICSNYARKSLFNDEFVPSNVLFITDTSDPNPTHSPADFMLFLSQYETNQTNAVIGSFSLDTAKGVYVTSSVFSHTSGMFEANSIKIQIEWMNLALGISPSEERSVPFIRFLVFLGFFLYSFFCLSGFGLVGKTITLFPRYLSSFKAFLYKSLLSNSKMKRFLRFLHFSFPFPSRKPKPLPSPNEEISPSPLPPTPNPIPVSSTLKRDLNDWKLLLKILSISDVLYLPTLLFLFPIIVVLSLMAFPPIPGEVVVDSPLLLVLFGVKGSLVTNLSTFYFPPLLYAYWTGALFLIRKKILKSKSYPVFKFSLAAVGKYVVSAGIGGGAFFLVWGMLKTVSWFLLGYQIPLIQIRSLLIAPLVFYGINLIVCEFFAKQHNPSEKGYSFHFIALYIIAYTMFLLPQVLFAGGSVFTSLLYFLLLALLNPGFYGKGFPQWIIAWFDYFLISFFFSWNIL